MQKILIMVNLVVVLAAAGVVFYAHNMIKPPVTDQALELENLKADALKQTQVQPVPIKKFVVNLHSKSSRLRYLDLELNVLTFTEEQKPMIKASEHLFKDTVIEVASHKAAEDLDSLTGKLLLENEIKKRVNAKLGDPPVIKQIYFSGFVVQ